MSDLLTLGPMPRADGLLGWFAETTLVASALAALAVLAGRVPRLAPGPAARHALWLMVMIKLVTPPMIHWPWSVPSPIAAIVRQFEGEEDRPARTTPDLRVLRDFEDSGPGRKLALAPIPDRPVAEPRPEPAPEPEPEPGPIAVADALAGPAAGPSPWAWVVAAWLCGSIALGIEQGARAWRFRRLLGRASEAPAWLVEEASAIGLRLDVRVPPIRVVPGLGTPVLWCLGRPVLLVPPGLLKTLEAGRWRSIVAHELAHLRRGDHWVRRLELVAGLAWWWNPLYWLARGRLDFEAELACDAWAVWASPEGRLTYAESLIRICTSLSPARSPRPALGVAGTGRSFERRLTMILKDRVDRRVTAPGLLAAALMAALALPSWTRASADDEGAAPAPGPAAAPGPVPAPFAPLAPVAPVAPAEPFAPLAPIAPIADDDDDDDKADAEKAARAKKQALEKKLESIGEEIEAKFGPGSEFEKKMEAFGKEVEKKLGDGSEFARKMEAFGKEMEAKFGPGSEFAKEIEAKFGPDSEFAKEIEKNIGAAFAFNFEIKDDADDEKPEAKKAKDRAQSDDDQGDADKAKLDADKARLDAKKAKDRAQADKARAESRKAQVKVEARVKTDSKPKAKARPSDDQRARRIQQLESRIDEMKAELKKLADDKDKDKDDEDEDKDKDKDKDVDQG